MVKQSIEERIEVLQSTLREFYDQCYITFTPAQIYDITYNLRLELGEAIDNLMKKTYENWVISRCQ